MKKPVSKVSVGLCSDTTNAGTDKVGPFKLPKLTRIPWRPVIKLPGASLVPVMSTQDRGRT